MSVFVPSHMLETDVSPPPKTDATFFNDLTKFLLKKDLPLSRLSYFTDHPESNALWKCSFKGIIQELGCTPAEELAYL